MYIAYGRKGKEWGPGVAGKKGDKSGDSGGEKWMSER